MGQTADGYVETASLSATHWLALGLVLVTGVIHVFVGLVEGRIPVLLAGVGFLGAAGLFLMDFRRTLLYLVGIVFTGIQIPLWYVAKAGEYTPVGYADKAIQVALIIVLAYLYWQQRQAPERRADATTA